MTKELMEVMKSLDGEIFSVWFLAGAALVFWMQAGFAMCEAGFTRAKNAGNIIMKNLMDFCIGTVMWFICGASLMLGPNIMKGFAGGFSFDVFTHYGSFNYSSFVFNLVFCATTATIVSGSMAERTKFSSYCIYSAVISAVIYPIEAHWTWGGGFLAQWGFHDYAGSTCIHMVGGICAFIGAWMLGPRIGKFEKDGNGKIVKVNAFPGHNLVIAALGVFILWLGWYGFNGAAATDVETLGSVFLVTTVAPSVATVVCMLFTWLKYGKPDVSMCLNASLAGLGRGCRCSYVQRHMGNCRGGPVCNKLCSGIQAGRNQGRPVLWRGPGTAWQTARWNGCHHCVDSRYDLHRIYCDQDDGRAEGNGG